MKKRMLRRSLVSIAVLTVSLTLVFGLTAWAAEGAESAESAESAEGATAGASLPTGRLLDAQAQELPSSFDLRAVDYDVKAGSLVLTLPLPT